MSAANQKQNRLGEKLLRYIVFALVARVRLSARLSIKDGRHTVGQARGRSLRGGAAWLFVHHKICSTKTRVRRIACA